MEEYKIVYQGADGEIVEKKSRFIANIRPVSSEEEALAVIEEARKIYWDARHHCFAYRIGDKNQTVRASDDGEPSQTAGKPMLDVLAGQDLHNVCAVVTRYFGGTLLGTGGLVRAYSQAVQEALKGCVIVTKKPGFKISIETDYNWVGKIQYAAGQLGITALDSEYTDKVVLTYMVPMDLADVLTQRVTEATAGRARIRRSDPIFYGMAQEKLILFD